MPDLSRNIRYIKGIGEKRARAFEKLGVRTLGDLISFYPRRYEDRSRIKEINSLEDGEYACIDVFVTSSPVLARLSGGKSMVRFSAADDTAKIDITYFNQVYLKTGIHIGDHLRLYGKAEVLGRKRFMTNPLYENAEKEGVYTGRIIPVYRSNAQLSQKQIMNAVENGLKLCEDGIEDFLPEDVAARNNLTDADFAVRNIHFPGSTAALLSAKEKLVFDELFLLACALKKMRSDNTKISGIRLEETDFEDFYKSLPFSPTNAQKRAVEECMKDMGSGEVMNRLLQGDVGSGKTLVAAALVWACSRQGLGSIFMAPTALLAEQHYNTLSKLLAPYGLNTALVTGSMTAAERNAVKKRIAEGYYSLVIGTHALFSEGMEYGERIALVITDEQHRFGVAQRARIIEKAGNPHVLVMSATPIPRTLALIIYGDLSISILDEMPPGRQKVDTFAVDSSYRQRINAFIRKQVQEGHQVFVVCPMIDENEEIGDVISAEEHAAYLKKELPELKVALLHGKTPNKEKDKIMNDFVLGKSDILVSTTIIEVGIDVPNASLIVIENAERFGLSQLHQLRGRVGRGEAKSYCVLFSDHRSEEVRARLKVMCETNDGFRVAEEDLRQRGPGDFFGSAQHGLPELHIADLGTDLETLSNAQSEAERVMESDPLLERPEHALLGAKISAMFDVSRDTFN